ncbi:hypothetical protein ACFL0W_00530 [Nanoarchaeota archaeon]
MAKKPTKKTKSKETKCCEGYFKNMCRGHAKSACNGGGIYCLGFIGALVYYISTATSFGNGLLGVLKALLWPAFLVYEALKFLGMN